MAQHGCNYRTRSATPRTRSEPRRFRSVGAKQRASGGVAVSKSTSARWYIGASVVTLIALGIVYLTGHSATASVGVSPLTAIAWGAAMIAEPDSLRPASGPMAWTFAV